ncbi:extracellular mutant protein 11-domain-containing protein [Microdochium trichocladiopsis]|uniref:Extracellular mutant protein 11-domain-containing protein n=1 Tax=Microdochium trichocladiopsis TaxID=1682393 RepID=A0A9P8Y6K3_9PEZI|nr:extracellular mutant protein 11-domain-containing protein [Microdochium trichocladiopsis]KAH7031209.1 extracellular mutant protein 11-domain-containing protein [Microdochium trichocladiopsis]
MNSMQQWVMQKSPVNSPPEGSQPGAATFEEDKTVTQGQFTKQFQAQHTAPPATEKAPLSPLPLGINTTRSASAAAARIPLSGDGYIIPNPGRPASANPIQQLRGRDTGPFWDGSTIDGEAFSDSASNFEFSDRPSQRVSRPSTQQTQVPRTHKQRDSYTSQGIRFKRENTTDDKDLMIGDDNTIGGAGSATFRPTSTPGPRDRRSHFSRVAADFERFSEDSQSLPSSPEPQSPSSRRSHRPRQVTVHASPRQDVKSNRPIAAGGSHRTQAPKTGRDKQPASRSLPPLAVAQPQNDLGSAAENGSEDADSYLPDSAETESDHVEQETTPKAARVSTKAAVSKPQVNRQLFSAGSSAGKDMQGPQINVGHTSIGLAPFMAAARKRPLGPDYDDQALASMAFDKLQNQDFDFDPAKAEALSAEIPQGTLEEKLSHFANRDKEAQSELFQKMPVSEWEESGDWFLERFSDIVKNFKQARKERRALADKFEAEVADRADLVRGRIERIDNTLEGMKEEGKGLMKHDFD